ncbi:MAG: MBL fold metallo-hydrolase [bacterium]
MTVVRFRHGPLWNFSYLIACEATGEAAVIDPAWDVPAILTEANTRGLGITNALLTHAHSDHANGLAEIVATTGAQVVLHDAEARLAIAQLGDLPTTFRHVDEFVLGEIAVRLVCTPGHTQGSVCFWAGGRLFTGDSMNVASPGTPGPEPGSLAMLWESTQVLRSLPPDTVLCPGHDSGPMPQSTLSAELRLNPAFTASSLEEFRAAVERATGRSHPH